MKRILLYIILLFSVLWVASCDWFEVPVPQPQGEFRLMLMTSGLETKGPETGAAGETALNENLIDSVAIFFYPNSADSNSNAVHCLKVVLPPNSQSIVTLDIPLTVFELENIFGPAPAIPAPATAKVYVIANVTDPANAVIDQIFENAAATPPSYAGTSIKSLKHLEVRNPGPYDTQTESSFGMDGSDVITLTADRKTITGRVKLDRVGCKIRLFITEIEPVLQIDGTDTLEWLPQPQYMRLFIFNGTRKSHIDETLFPFTPAPEDYFTIRGNNMVLVRTLSRMPADTTQALQYWFNPIPYYSYPYHYDPTSGLDHTSLVLVLPWLCPMSGHTHSHNTYYQIPITRPGLGLNLVRNSYYQIYVTVGMLGNFEESDPLEIPFSVIVADWTTAEIKAEIREFQYLTVDRNNAELINQHSGIFHYSSSSPVSVKINSITYMNYAGHNFQQVNVPVTGNGGTSHTVTENRTVHPPGGSAYTVQDAYKVSVEPGNIIKFERNIPSGVFTSSTITFTVTNENGFSETITVEQFPPIYLTGEKSFVASNYGSVIVYGNRSKSGTSYDLIYDDQNRKLGAVQRFGGVDGSGTNNNQNQYNIHVGSLAAGFLSGDNRNYAIGDPRVPLSEAAAPSGLYNYNQSNTLELYRKTRTGDEASDMIAPVYKIASSYGKTTYMNFAQAEKRCAAYQENGYPAGRWRVPTEAEIWFIANRSRAGVFPTLFDGRYWASSGRFYNSINNIFEAGGNSERAVRCVYDVWYWGDEKGDYNSDGAVDYGTPMIGTNPNGNVLWWGNPK